MYNNIKGTNNFRSFKKKGNILCKTETFENSQRLKGYMGKIKFDKINTFTGKTGDKMCFEKITDLIGCCLTPNYFSKRWLHYFVNKLCKLVSMTIIPLYI